MHALNQPIDLELARRIRLHAVGTCDDESLKQTILATRFFAQAPDQPGFLATPTPTGPVIPVFTSVTRLARHAGAVRWFATTGLDLIWLAPVGHRFVVDPGSPHEIVIDPEVFGSTVTGSS